MYEVLFFYNDFFRLSKSAVNLEQNKTIKGEIDSKWVTSLN